MTRPSPATAELFRSALEAVRSHPLDPGRKPAFALPAAEARAPIKKDGAVTGPPGDIWSTLAALKSGSVSVIDVVDQTSVRIEAHDGRLHAFEHVAEVRGLATQLHEELRSGTCRGPLHGIPLSVKDIIDVAGMPTTGSSAALAPRLARRDATAVSRLKQAGGIIVGKTVTHEFALGVTTPQSHNPWDETRVPGGSSGGSAISVATGMALGSLGTDTRASIRVPAALSGVVGFRPTIGLVPIDRWIPLSWSMDVLAPMARSVRDIALLMDVLTGLGSAFRSALPGSLKACTVGYSDAFIVGTEPGVRRVFEQALQAAETAGASVVFRDAPTGADMELSNYAGMIISRSEAAQFHLDAGTDLALCTPEVRDQLQEAQRVEATDYIRCLRIRDELYERFCAIFDEVDFLLMPTSEIVAPLHEEADRYLLVLSENCIPWSLIGFPAISLFAGTSDGLPVGVQLVAGPGQDSLLLAAAHALEAVLPPIRKWRP
jgi:aspartyl-tRNA(Asn)/glutamyl-tRNA(Gln) amidotransferase subunit A